MPPPTINPLGLKNYIGLTVVLSNPSRFDKKKLLEGTGGWFFENECLMPDTSLSRVQVRLCDNKTRLLPGTTCLLLLGQRALSEWTNATTSLGEQRGSPLKFKFDESIPCIASFLPQDTVDVLNYEKRFNPEADGYEEQKEETDEGVQGVIVGSKGHGKTKRANWRFWLARDTKKAIRYAKSGGIPECKFRPIYKIYPSACEIIDTLNSTEGRDLYFDIETDFDTLDMRCFAFTFGENSKSEVVTYVVPILDTQYKLSYGLPDTSKILQGLCRGFSRNCAVAHNGAGFDFLVFAERYRIPIGRICYDTMVAQQRIYPLIERSLGHCVSLWTDEAYHKNEGDHIYLTERQAQNLYLYCGKDVYTMFLVKKAQEEMAAKIPGLRESLDQVMSSIKPYLTTTLLGMRYDRQLLEKRRAENDRIMMQYLRILSLLTGPNVLPLISNQKCCKYFHEQLHYKPVGYTKKGVPSLAEENLLKLKLKYDNPVIDILIKYRGIKKETGVLGFEPWRKEHEVSEM